MDVYLKELDIPYLNGDSGLFLWMNFRHFFPSLLNGVTEAKETLESKEKREQQLDLSLMKEHGLLFTPWNEYEKQTWGILFMRREEEFQLGLVRLRMFVKEMRN